MATRRKPAAPEGAPADAPPTWLFRFRYAEWEDGYSPENPNLAHWGKPLHEVGFTVGQYQRAKRRYEAAAEAWLAERGLYARGLREPREWQEFQRMRREEPWKVFEHPGEMS
ncbi:hypothetical protein [Planomonospora sp. ID82291]|uniref:hypothetical protein n=1 Tax=Planomonospora sp. ID82291 TaxID=2738136 RepID=UPI0018C42258|nr:hypothetical protein [Planomonospora sp. ID82291]MBG0818199.1 hypothetical protein [Planomonospora sp. ID82291]